MVNTLFLGAAGSTSIDMRDQGNIVAVAISGVDVALGGIELSFNSQPQLAQTDTTGTIASITTAGTNTLVSQTIHNIKEPVEVGERLFMHVVGGGNTARAVVYTDTASARTPVRRR